MTEEAAAASSEREYSEAERNAMRAYLARCEVRMSTLHRIALAFIGGAGLLILIPVFFKDVIDNIIIVFLANASNQFAEVGHQNGLIVSLVMYAALGYPLLLSLSIPLYGVYLLLMDIVHFYFTIYMPGFSDQLLNPTFGLTGLTFSVDESLDVKREVMRYQYKPQHIDFMLPFSAGRRKLYFDTIIGNTKGNIFPESRSIERLRALGVLNGDEEKLREVQHFNAAFGIARSLDRTLVEEVAIAEMAVVRNILYLRRIMLRYIKTLLMFIWTTVVSFMMLPFLLDKRFPTFVILGLGYVAWSLAVMWIMRWPINWIYRHRLGDVNPEHIDPQLILMEHNLRRFCYIAIGTAGCGLVLAILGVV